MIGISTPGKHVIGLPCAVPRPVEKIVLLLSVVAVAGRNELRTRNTLQMPYITKAASFFQKEAMVAGENEGVLEGSGKQ